MEDSKIEQPLNDDESDRPLSLKEIFVIVLSGHIGVRKRAKRVSDFSRARGGQVFIAAVFYFALIVSGLIALVIYIAG